MLELNMRRGVIKM